nr:MAG TPA: hypothetical protein [Caudoviricetes sp.]
MFLPFLILWYYQYKAISSKTVRKFRLYSIERLFDTQAFA